jgi:GGDEF domain-containing protein
MKLDQDFLLSILDSLEENMLVILDNNQKIQFQNTFFTRFFGDQKQQDINNVIEKHSINPGVSSYSNSYTDYLFQTSDGMTKSFRSYKKIISGQTVLQFVDTSRLRALHQKNDSLEKQVISNSTQVNLNGVYPTSFFEKEFPILFNAYSRTGSKLSFIRVRIDRLEEYLSANGPDSQHYLLSEVSQRIKAVLRRKEDLIIELDNHDLTICLFNTPLWEPKELGTKKSAEFFAQKLQEQCSSIEIPSHSLRKPMESVHLSIGIIESYERETLESLLDRSLMALDTSISKGDLCISVPAPPVV